MSIDIVSLEKADRIIYETLRLLLVAGNHLPDVVALDDDAYLTAEKAKETAGTLIKLYGVGHSESRDNKDAHRIVINRKSITPDNTGGGSSYFTPVTNEQDEVIHYKKDKYPTGAVNIAYEIRGITNTSNYERIIASVVYKALGFNKYLSNTDVGVIRMLCNFNGELDASSTDFIEKVYNYTLVSVWLEDTAEALNDEVSVLTRIEFDIRGETPEVSLEEGAVGEPIPEEAP